MDFEELYKYCVDMNKSTLEKCLVCHMPIDKTENHLILACKHYYHSECINYYSGLVTCLYCEKVSEPQIDSKNIYCKVIIKSGSNKGKYCDRLNCNYHKQDNLHIIKQKTFDNEFCNVIIMNGRRKGQVCNRKNPCLYHVK